MRLDLELDGAGLCNGVAFSLKTKPDEPYSPAKRRATGPARRPGAPVTRHTPAATPYTS
jgi:hypothetical protein